MKIFITGATGFLGRALCKQATDAGHEILALCRTGTASAVLPKECRVAAGTLSSLPWQKINDFMPESAVHLAWIATPGIYLHSPENTELVGESAAMFRGLIDQGVAHLMGTGTCIEYAPTDELLNEERSCLGPIYPYAQAKVETSKELQRAAEQAGVSWTWVRPFYPYGESEHPDRLPSMIGRRLIEGRSVELKTPFSVKDYIHVDDIASAMLASLENRLSGCVNIATGTGVQIMTLAKMIAVESGCDPARISHSQTILTDPFPTTVADISKLREVGWRPRVTLEAGLARLCASIASHQRN